MDSRHACRARRARLTALFACLALGLTACAGTGPQRDTAPTRLPAPGPELDDLYNQEPDWRTCGDDVQCASVQVPVDWAEPSGETLSLSLSRRMAEQTPRGAVVVNFGGPGVAGAQILRSNPGVLGADVRRHYDVVAFDPRGSGTSEPIDCLTDSELDGYLAEPQDTSHAHRLAGGCRRDAPALVGHLGTDSVVRDLDLIRSVLDQTRLNYLGYSYGTLIGALYADRMPTNVGRFVLDAALDPSLPLDRIVAMQAAGMEQALSGYVAGCLDGEAGRCPLSGDLDQAMGQVGDVLASAADEPMPTGTRRRLTGTLATTGVISALYRESSWPDLSNALDKARDGDGSGLLKLADEYNGRTPSGEYSSNIAEAYWAVTCLDYPVVTDPAEVAATRDETRRYAPVLGPYMAYDTQPCAGWPVPNTRTPAPVSGHGAPPILVIGTTIDPATPYPMAQSLAGQLASGVLLTRDGQGHAAYRQGNSCIDKIVDTYWLDGEIPAEGTRCR